MKLAKTLPWPSVLMLGLAGCGTEVESSASDLDALKPQAPGAAFAARFEGGGAGDLGAVAPEDWTEEVRRLRQAAERGDVQAQSHIGFMYMSGEGVPENATEALRWLGLAAEQGDATAQNNLGVMYDKGQGIAEDDAEAVRWYRLAAEQGDAVAQHNLGLSTRAGRGSPRTTARPCAGSAWPPSQAISTPARTSA